MRSVKKWLSGLLCLALLLTALPTAALAAGDTGEAGNSECNGTLQCSASTHTENCPRNTTELTRAKLAEKLYGHESLKTSIDNMGANGAEPNFNDITVSEGGVTEDQNKAIVALYKAKIISGTSENTFNPTGTVTRAELAVVFWRVTGSKSTGDVDVNFSDVSPSDWFAPAVTSLFAMGLISGTGTSEGGAIEFNPDGEEGKATIGTANALLIRYDEKQTEISNLQPGVTRAEMAVEAYNKYKGSPYAQAKIAEVESPFTSKLRDIDDCSPDEKEAILFFEKLGIAKGYNEPEGEEPNQTYPFYPDVPASNLQIAAFLMQCAQLDQPDKETDTGETVETQGTPAVMVLSAAPLADKPTMDDITNNLLTQIKGAFGEDSTIATMAASNPNAPAAASAPKDMAGSITVTKPTISFAEGKATITAAEGATIYYTAGTDDSVLADPTINDDQKYTDKTTITLSQGLIIKAIAVQYSLSSAVVSTTYKMTITPSSTTLTGSDTVTFTLTNVPTDAEISVTCDNTTYNPTKDDNGTWSVTLPNADATYTFTVTAGTGDDAVTAGCTVKVTYKSTGGGNTGGSSSRPSNTTTTTERNPDGSTTTTTTNKATGTVTETTRYPDGSREVVETKKDGTVTTTTTDANGTSASAVTDPDGRTEAEVSVSARAVDAAQKEGGAVTLPIPNIPVSDSGEDTSLVEIDLPRSAGAVKVEIPTEDTGPGTVAVIVNDDGTETVVKKSVALDGGLTLTLEAGAAVKLVDNSKDFDDTYGHWAADAIDFATAHEIFGGTSAATFSPDSSMTRGMLAVVLHRFEDTPSHTFTGGFEDVAPGSWYAEAIGWAAEQGIIGGYGDGRYGADDAITREQLAVMLWRYAGRPDSGYSLNRFTDADAVGGYARTALAWASENGIVGGYADGSINPKGTATRAHVVVMFMRMCVSQFR